MKHLGTTREFRLGRHSNYVNDRPRDYWPTVDPSAVTRLVPFIRGITYAEPCYGAGDLEDLLMDVATCKWRSDIEPQVGSAKRQDALTLTKEDLYECSSIITNPPFSWSMLQPLLDHLPNLKPTWLLLPSGFMFNKRSSPYMQRCSHAVTVGRLFWITEGGDPTQRGVKGKDDYVWLRFTSGEVNTRFYNTRMVG